MIAKEISTKIAWSTLVQYFGRIITMVLGIIAIKLVTNYLGPEKYGLYGKISEYSLFFSTIANLGIFGNIVRKMSTHPTDGKFFINAMLLRIFLTIIFFSTGLAIALFFIPNRAFALGSLFYLGALFLDYITSIATGTLQANYMMGRSVFANITGRSGMLLVIIILISIGIPKSAPLFFLAPMFSALVTMLLSLFFVSQKIKFIWELDLHEIRKIFTTSLPFGIINITNNLYFRFLPSFFAAKILTASQFGTYNISLHIATVAAILSTFLMFSTLPEFKEALAEGHIRKAKNLYKLMQKIMFGLGLILAVAGSFLAPTAIKILTNKEFIVPELWFVLPLLLLLSSISYFYDLILITIFAFEKEIWLLKREFLALFTGTLIMSTAFLITKHPELGIIPVLLGAVIAELIMVLFGSYKVGKCFIQVQQSTSDCK